MDCFYCPYSAEEPKDLAHHIISMHPKKRNKWAAKVVTNYNQLNRKADLQKQQDRVPLTEEEKEAKRSTQRTLSGIEKTTQTLCLTCNQVVYQKLPVEYIQSNEAWRRQGTLVVTCLNCRK